jgi:hypothetical protein
VRETVGAKARRYLVEGRLVVHHVDERTARAECRGDGATWPLGFEDGRWWCACPTRGRCSHQLALGLVTSFKREWRA